MGGGRGRRYKPKAEQKIVLKSRVLRNNCLEGLFTQSQVLLSSIVSANGRNIVGQQLPTLLDVTCYVRLHTLLHIVLHVAQSLKQVKLFSQQLPTFLLLRDRRDVAQQCWIRWHSSSNTWFTKAYGLFFPRCTAGLNMVGSCCIRLHATANTGATTPNIVGVTMLGVVSVCP